MDIKTGTEQAVRQELSRISGMSFRTLSPTAHPLALRLEAGPWQVLAILTTDASQVEEIMVRRAAAWSIDATQILPPRQAAARAAELIRQMREEAAA